MSHLSLDFSIRRVLFPEVIEDTKNQRGQCVEDNPDLLHHFTPASPVVGAVMYH